MNMNWSAYAESYDLLAEANPAYQDLLRHCRESVRSWSLQSGATIADFGAGTGNFSIAMAQSFPHIRVLHIERDPAMLAHAKAKAQRLSLSNWQPIAFDLEQPWPEMEKVAGAISIHAIYTLANPQAFIRAMSAQVVDDGFCYIADIGRTICVLNWACYFLQDYYSKHGLLKMARFFRQTKAVRKANRQISRLQRNGVYWRHNLAEFKAAFETYGWKIRFASGDFYCGITDVVAAQKDKTLPHPITDQAV